MMSHNMVMLAQRIAPSGGGGSFDLGLDTIAGTPDSWGSDITLIYRAQASGTGTLQNGFVYFTGTPTPKATVKLAVYTSASTTPGAGDTQVGISGIITGGGSNGWQSAAMSGGTITSGNFYWMCIFVSTTQNMDVASSRNKTLWYKSASGYYVSPPTDLSGVVSSLANFADLSAYVTAQ